MRRKGTQNPLLNPIHQFLQADVENRVLRAQWAERNYLDCETLVSEIAVRSVVANVLKKQVSEGRTRHFNSNHKLITSGCRLPGSNRTGSGRSVPGSPLIEGILTSVRTSPSGHYLHKVSAEGY